MKPEGKVLTPDKEAYLRERLANNPFVRFMGVEVPELKEGYARFTLKIRPDFHNSQGFLQGGVIASLADEAGLTLVGFLRGTTMNVYAGAHRVSP